jgi:tetratricopeptide (TPR) repeat protein
VLHALIVVALFHLVRRLGGGIAAAAIGAAIFAVHPVHVEAVANIVGRSELIAALFALLACHAHITCTLRPALRIGVTALCYAIALGGKEIAITLPLLLALIDHVRGERFDRHAFGALAVVLIVYVGARAAVLGGVLGSQPASYLFGVPIGERIAMAVATWPRIALLLLWPATLSSEWGPGLLGNPVGWTDPAVLGGLLLLAAVIAGVVLSWRRERLVALALLWFVIAYAPVSNVLWAGGTILAERALYLPTVGLAFLAVPFAHRIHAMATTRRQLATRATAFACIAIVLLATARTWTRTPVWQSTDTLAAALVADHPDSFRTIWRHADQRVLSNDLAGALPLYRQAADLTRGYEYGLDLNFASVLIASGRPGEAEGVLVKAVERTPYRAQGRFLLAGARIAQSRFHDAIVAVDDALAQPRVTSADSMRLAHAAALAYDGLGDTATALDRRLASLGGEADLVLEVPGASDRPTKNDALAGFEPWAHLARLEYVAGHPREAKRALERARALAPIAVRDSLTLAALLDPRSRFVYGPWLPLAEVLE